GVEFEITDLDGYTVVDANGNEIDKVYTDSNGKIRLSLTEGLYKATETKPLEGYATPEVYTGIGIGASKEAEYKLKLTKKINSKDMLIEDSDLIADTDDGFIVIAKSESDVASTGGNIMRRYDFAGNVIWEKLVSYASGLNQIIRVEDAILGVGQNGTIIKYDFDGNIIWKNIVTEGYNFRAVGLVPDGIIITTANKEVIKYDLNGNKIWETIEENLPSWYSELKIGSVADGFIFISSNNLIKYDFDGNKILEISKPSQIEDFIVVNEEIFAIFNNGKLAKYDSNFNLIWQNTEKTYSYSKIVSVDDGIVTIGDGGEIVKYNFNGEVVWENVEKNYLYSTVIKISDGLVAISSIGQIVKYDFNGNIVWENLEKSYIYTNDVIEKIPNGIITASRNGQVTMYDNNLIKIWENSSKDYEYEGITVIDDGIVVVALNGQVVKYDFDGNIVWENTEKKLCYYRGIVAVENGIIAVGKDGTIVKYDFDGNIIWEGTEIKSGAYYWNVTKVEDGVVAVASNGLVAKYDFDGNIVWENADKSYFYKGITSVEDGFIAAGSNGKVVKYDLNGNIVWENTEKTYTYNGIISVKDGVIIVSNLGKIVKYDLNGNVIFENNEIEDTLYGIVETESGIITGSYTGIIAEYEQVITEPEFAETQDITVFNELKKYKITTKVNGDGGNISGRNEEPYEEVKYKENSVKDIIATPAIGYKVQDITINGEEIKFTENSDGTVTLEKFTAMTEDKEVIVTFFKVNNSLIISKKDSNNDNLLKNAKFNIKQLETRSEPVKEEIIGKLVANGTTYYKADVNNRIENTLGTITNNNDTYYFIDNGNGGYESNNQGQASTTANSYMTINLEGYEGKYAVVVNANISSQYSDYGYATITTSTAAPSHSTSSNRILRISGTSETTPKDYTIILDGGSLYYLHLGYYKNSSTDEGEDKFTVNSVNVYNTISNTYNFIDNGNGGYESNNQGQANTIANSYIPIDLTGYEGQYNLIVNVSISSQYLDYGYATITTNTNAPEYNDMDGRFIYIYDTYSSRDYSTILEGGKLYYLHLGYYKNSSTDNGEDKFTINSINLTLNQDDFIDTDVITNSSGEAVIELKRDWKYQITEVEAPEGYTLDSTPIIYDFVAGQENVITVENDPQVDIIVHHYLKGTTTSVAPDETQKGDLGKEYTTQPKMDLVDYQLVKNEDGSYQIPDNASGIYTEETQVITYYYEVAPVQLIVHHYIDGTEDSVAPDVTSE
ncbi:MAG: MucBP domain-containing protein, partial [Clostridia bacterium]|nr:MucBP domain-containing protein [Clostridia bacterium]